MSKPTIHELLKSGGPVVGPGVYDCISARLCERAGFPMAFLSGYCLSASLLGEPDFGLLTQTQVLEAADRIANAVNIPLIVDIDTGYGNAFNVEKTVEALLRMGAAGCFLEDQVWPKRCGHMEGKRVVDLDEYLPKLRAALKTREGTGFHVTARTDSIAAIGFDEALKRAKIFAEEGADAVFVEAPRSIEELHAIRETVPAEVTVVANMVENGKTPLLKTSELYRMGFGLIAAPVAVLFAGTQGMEELLKTLKRDETTHARHEHMYRFDQMGELVGLPERYEREKAWLK
ncbi:MAG: isocitrate lyase/PEP mutase family protein [Chrysiogenetes bacterium]|nr:isocitrate lyase/PEP mutase family protein [Chrysiogenetes bacterium]